MKPARLVLTASLWLGIAAGLASCGDERVSEVVLYTSLNEPTARAVLDPFEKATGIRVRVVADTERDKTVGLVQTLLEEKPRPRADVFWNSETAHTVRLKAAGVLERLDPQPKEAEGIPARFHDPEGYWFGFAARARVLVVNTERMPDAEARPRSTLDLVDPKHRGRAAIVRPVTGTTLTHVAALHHVMGESETRRWLDGIRDNGCALPPGNGALARLVGEGKADFGFTDTSDLRMVAASGAPVVAVFPDQDTFGTLLIPNTVARVRGGPNPANARRLLSYLLSEESERILAHHPRGHIPLRPGVSRPPDVKVPGEFKEMDVDLVRVGLEVADRMAEMDRRFR